MPGLDAGSTAADLKKVSDIERGQRVAKAFAV
jgi:hypothetical protein